MRGLDYYTHTAFEFTTTALGAQGTVLAGGRYDYLIEQLGGPADARRRLGRRHRAPGPADDQRPVRPPRPIAVVPVGAEAEMRRAQADPATCAAAGFTVELGFSGNLKKRMKRANKLNARAPS